MAADDQIPLSLPDTQNTDILTPLQSQDDESHSQQRLKTWGKLYPSQPTFMALHMTKNEYTLGRNKNCDICLSNQQLEEKRLSVISKQHFRIVREILNTGIDDVLVYLEDKSHNGTFVNKTLVGRGKQVVLENNDTISLAQPSFLVYTYMNTTSSESSGLPPELKCKYAISRTLGSGACGEVKLILAKAGCKRFALKTIVKNKFLTTDNKNPFNNPDKILNEVKILKDLRHPCIVRMEEILDTPTSVYIVLELMEGGELFDRIRKSKCGLTERNAKLIFYQVSLAVHYLHQRGIAHRDLKPENILLASDAEVTLVKVSDFGLSKLVDTQTMMRTFCGTPMYVAPEVLKTNGRGSYTNQVDVWSLGVILYCCLSGLVPFSAHDKRMSLEHQIKNGIYHFDQQRFSRVSERAKSLIRAMLTVDPEIRITISRVFQHAWLQDGEMRRIVGSLMDDGSEFNENMVPFPSASRAMAPKVRCARRQMQPPTAAFKRARVE